MTRILSIDPTSKGFAFAVLDHHDLLIDFGTARLRKRSFDAHIARLERFLGRLRPDLLVLEDGRSSRRGPRARSLMLRMREAATARGIEIQLVTRRHVRDLFAGTGTTKQEIAEAICSLFPELEPRLPRPRRPWMSEDERMNIFDAVSFALAALHERDLPSIA